MLKIRLTRIGKRHQPFYRIIVKEARSKRDGDYTDILGTYNPMVTPKEIKLDVQKYDEWISKGAQPSDTVRALHKQIMKSANKKSAKKVEKGNARKTVKKTETKKVAKKTTKKAK